MNAESLVPQLAPAEAALTHRFLLDYPHEAARLFEAMPAPDAAALIAAQPAHAAMRAWESLAPDVALDVLEHLPKRRHSICWPRPIRWPASQC